MKYADRHLNDVKLNSQELFFAMAYSNAEKAVKKAEPEQTVSAAGCQKEKYKVQKKEEN